MAINLQKGQKVELKKSDGGALKRVMIGLGWDAAEPKKVGIFTTKPKDIDCDASVFLCTNGKVADIREDVIYFGHLEHKSGCVRHMGDNLTGEGDGDDEEVFVNLEKLPEEYDKVIFVVNIYQAVQRKQDFGMIKNAFIRIVDDDSKKELCRYNLSEDYAGMLAMIFGEIYRYNGVWKFNAIGQGTRDNSITEMVKRFR